ncbi:MAG: ABC-F family ATP-binding cassette domain-containing protein [Verrucomicrobiales bacterium]|nr:ABC-F family ATP-binding cassette domain-containing protein [Verrucomicrobiales bacterium]
MLAVDRVTVQYGARNLFRDLSFTVRPKERWSLAGPNGAGKSTLMKIIAGIEKADTGGIIKAKQTTVGYLPQEGVSHKGSTVMEEVEKAFDDVRQLQIELKEVEAELETVDPSSEAYGDLLEVFGDLTLRLDHHDVSKMKPRIATVLGGLGFSKADFDRQTGEFSGGWQMRIAMAKLLLQEPSVLLLDEPTNHLDIETVQWLEQWLRNYGGAIILISHDRSMLDNLTNRTLAFENGGVQQYSGNYSFYLAERVARREQAERAFKNQAREIEKAEKLINRFRAKASKARMVQSRIKALEKVERIELEQDAATMDFRFPQPERSGQTVLKLEKVCRYYGDNKVIENLDFAIERGDKIAIVGVNGAGKSTFSRLIARIEEPTSGTITEGHKVGIAYFSQTHADELDPTKTVLGTMEGSVTAAAAGNLRTLLGAFLFRGDDVFKSVSVLSGGERGRLALARMLLQPANFLILDEPTNHLDLQSQEVLQRALADYSGAFAIVSHNRSFLDPIVTKVLEFIPGQKPKLYYGNVSDYLEKKKADMELEAGRSNPASSPSGKGPAASSSATSAESGANRKEQRRLEAKAREERAQKLRPLKKEFEAVEAEIAKLETEKAELDGKLADPEFFKKGDEASVAMKRYSEIEALLESRVSKWGDLSDRIEKLENEA